MVNTVRISANHGRDFNPLTDHITKLQNFTKGENHDFSAFRFSLFFTLSLTIFFLFNSLSDDFTKTSFKSCTNEPACCNEY